MTTMTKLFQAGVVKPRLWGRKSDAVLRTKILEKIVLHTLDSGRRPDIIRVSRRETYLTQAREVMMTKPVTKLYAIGERVDFVYTTEEKPGKPSKNIHVVGEVVKPSGNVKPDTGVITVKLDEPRDGRPFISCKVNRIPFALAV
jgi:hypothetical protein